MKRCPTTPVAPRIPTRNLLFVEIVIDQVLCAFAFCVNDLSQTKKRLLISYLSDFSSSPSLRTPSLKFSSSAQNEIRRYPSLSLPNAPAGIVTTPASKPASATRNESPYLLTSTIV